MGEAYFHQKEWVKIFQRKFNFHIWTLIIAFFLINHGMHSFLNLV